jgi:putative FmdB family regulatory protein
MPNYDYLCEACGPFAAHAPMAEYDKPKACPGCGGAADRAILTPPRLAIVGSAMRSAHETNERARHEPKRSGHGPGCSCCGGGAKGKSGTLYRPDGSKSFPAKRPWMISH